MHAATPGTPSWPKLDASQASVATAIYDRSVFRGNGIKAMLRKAGERTVSGLWSLIGKLVDLFQPQECANYFSSCGYDPN
jgi:hypothetical protein